MTREDLELVDKLAAIPAPPPPAPTVGRIVHYYPQSYGISHRIVPPEAAMITYVHNVSSPGAVALEVFGHPEKVIHRGVPFSPTAKGGCWSWPPR